MKIKNMDEFSRPREKMIMYGIESLDDYELLALLLDTGTKNESVIDLSKRIINEFGFKKLFMMNYKEISKIKGIKKAKASKLLATFEVTRRIISDEVEDRKLIDAKNVFDFIYPSYYMIDYEKLAVIYVDTLFHVIKKEEYTSNSKSHIEFPFKDITISALKTNCFGIFLVHNHPQGTLEPSMNDLNQTKKMSDILKAIDIHLFDHLIIAKGLYFSFSDSNILFEKKLT